LPELCWNQVIRNVHPEMGTILWATESWSVQSIGSGQAWILTGTEGNW
jgi:hypothetical protein